MVEFEGRSVKGLQSTGNKLEKAVYICALCGIHRRKIAVKIHVKFRSRCGITGVNSYICLEMEKEMRAPSTLATLLNSSRERLYGNKA